MHFLEVKYETSPEVPPPYCYYYHVKGQVVDHTLRVTFDWVYHNREGLSEEDIAEEGFSGMDDYHWQGSLHSVWLEAFEKRLAKTGKATPNKEYLPYLHLTVKGEKETIFEGEPANVLDWDYFLQEFIQAIYETAEKEAPLQLGYKKISTEKEAISFEVVLHFKDRTVAARCQADHGKPKSLLISWEAMQPVLQSIYALDYHPALALVQEPEQAGFYMQMGEEGWYELGKGARNPSKRKNHIAIITGFFENLQLNWIKS